MARKPLADIPGNAKFDAGLRDLASLAAKLAEEAGQKAGRAKSLQEKQVFEQLAEQLDNARMAAKDMRHKLWEVVG